MEAEQLSPTSIIVTTPTQIIYGDNQFNQTLLNQIEQITASAADSKGVTGVSGTTRPYGNVFNYSSVENMSEPIQMQYESQMFSTIGKNNETAVITVSLSNSAESSTCHQSLHEMEKNISQLPLISGIVFTLEEKPSQPTTANVHGKPDSRSRLDPCRGGLRNFVFPASFSLHADPPDSYNTLQCRVLFSACIYLFFYMSLTCPSWILRHYS